MEDILERFKVDIKYTRVILVVFLLVASIVRFGLGMDIPLPVFGSLIVWFTLYVTLWPFFLFRVKKESAVYNLYFFFNTIDLLLLTVAVYYLGGAAWVAPVFYMITLVMAGLLIPKKRAILLALVTLFYYTALSFLQFWNILPYRNPFSNEVPPFSWEYMVTNILVVGAAFVMAAVTVGDFSEKLKNKTDEVEKERARVEEALDKAKEMEKVLGVRVRARTRELRALAKKQEEIIEERTKELKERLEELEKFRKLTVGREMKMIKLKEELKKLKDDK